MDKSYDELVPKSIQAAKVLVCEDDSDTRSVIRFSLEADGHTVIEAGDGKEACDICTRALPDMMVVDIMMPRMTGTEFVQWFRETFRERYVPVLFLTALDQLENRLQGFAVGGDDYMTKPFHSQELQARVRALLKTKVLVEELSLRTRELEQSNAALQAAQQKIVEQERIVVAAQLAGAAAHGLGQPLQSILLHCHVMEKALQNSSGDNSQALLSLKGVKAECEWIRTILSKLESVDPNRLASYVGDESIIDISSAPEIAPEKK